MIDPSVALYHLNDLLLDAKELLQAHRDTPHWTLNHAYLFDQVERIELILATTGTDPQAVLTAYNVPDLTHLTYDQADTIIARQRNLRHKQRLSGSLSTPSTQSTPSTSSQEPQS